MPRSISVKCLSELCVDFIKNNMNEFLKLSSLRLPTGVDAYNSESSHSPFDFLPSIILEGIIKHLILNNQLKEQYLELLITPHLRTLDFSMCDKNSISGLLRLASKRCPHLRSLWLGRLGYFLGCLNFIPKFTHLQVLDISGSLTADSLLHLLGVYCKDLRELHINDSLVSNNGIHGLCVIGNCKSLRILNLTNVANVTRLGVTMALTNLPLLKDLRHDSVVQTLVDLHQSALKKEVPTSIKYALSVLTIRCNTPYRRGNLSQVMLLCPSLTKVDIMPPDCFVNMDILDLFPAEKLFDLTISVPHTRQISFCGGVAPLFQNSLIGNSLKSLTLSNFAEINIRIITEYCPNLRSLNLDGNRFEEFDDGEKCPMQQRNFQAAPKTLKKLQTLRVSYCNSPSILVLLLSSPSLVSVKLAACHALTDEVLQSVTVLDSFRNLEHFEIISNSKVTKKGIDSLMTGNNPLKVIKLKECNLTNKNVEDWKQQILVENWQLSILKESRFD